MSERYRQCKNCEYFQSETHNFWNECHRRAPVGNHDDRGQPKIQPNSWCGEWTPKDYLDNPAIKTAWDEFKTLHILAMNHD